MGVSRTNVGRTCESQLQIKQRNNLFYLLYCDVNKCTTHTYTCLYTHLLPVQLAHMNVTGALHVYVCVYMYVGKCFWQLVRLQLLQIVVDTLEAGHHGWCHQCLQQFFQLSFLFFVVCAPLCSFPHAVYLLLLFALCYFYCSLALAFTFIAHAITYAACWHICKCILRLCMCINVCVQRKLLRVHLVTLSEWSTHFSHTYTCITVCVSIAMFIWDACVRRASHCWQLLPVDISSVLMPNNFAFSDIFAQSSASSDWLQPPILSDPSLFVFYISTYSYIHIYIYTQTFICLCWLFDRHCSIY